MLNDLPRLTIGSGVRRDPNTKATTAELYDGLAAASQNRWPSLAHDIGAVNDLTKALENYGVSAVTYFPRFEGLSVT